MTRYWSSGLIAIAGLCFILALCANAQLDKCSLPLMEGNCSESIQRWYFNNRTGLCQSFIYRGCAGNANNFNSTMYCYMACNVSQDGSNLGMYSIEERARMLKAQQQATAVAGAVRTGQTGTGQVAIGPDGSVVALPSNSDNLRRPASAGVGQTKEPTVRQERTRGAATV